MTDEKKKGKALNALKKKFNTGGRVNARRGGRRNNLSFSKEDLNTAQAKEFFRSTSKTSAPKKSTQDSLKLLRLIIMPTELKWDLIG